MALLKVVTIHPPGIIYEDHLGKDGKNGVKNRECSQSDGLMSSRYKSDRSHLVLKPGLCAQHSVLNRQLAVGILFNYWEF